MSMINGTAVRLCVVIGVVLATAGVAKLVKGSLDPPGVEMPDWRFSSLPLDLGQWHGKPTEMDDKITAATDAAPGTTTSRLYQDESGHNISTYAAMFSDPRGGVYHTPINCYRASGWQLARETREDLEVSDELTIPVSVSTWEQKGERVIVVYWYQLGEHVLFDRWDLGMKIRWALRGRPKWPALIKVMLQISISPSDPDAAKPAIMDFAKQVAAWENQPKHRLLTLGEAGPSSPQQPGTKK